MPAIRSMSRALLIVELDGPAAEVDHLIERVDGLARGQGATEIRVSRTEEERVAFWAGRKNAFPAVGRISPDYYCMDGTIPRGRLPEVLDRMDGMSAQYGLRVANVFHAGDGNLHPLILYDANVPGELERAEEFGADILKLCVEVGGVLTGEHGVGVEKRDLMGEMFSEDDLKQQQRVKCAFDPDQLLNPGKVFPRLHRCAELGGSTSTAARRASQTCRGFSRDFSRWQGYRGLECNHVFREYRHSAPDRADPILPPLRELPRREGEDTAGIPLPLWEGQGEGSFCSALTPGSGAAVDIRGPLPPTPSPKGRGGKTA